MRLQSLHLPWNEFAYQITSHETLHLTLTVRTERLNADIDMTICLYKKRQQQLQESAQKNKIYVRYETWTPLARKHDTERVKK